jgi:glycosyltransferase involved in cell wall biosynthesis
VKTIEQNCRVKVSVIVPHYSALLELDNCLSHLQGQTFPANEMEIIVADNCSPEGAAAVAEVIKNRATLIEVSEKGAGPARNGGVAASCGEILAFLDSDCQPDMDWLSEGVRALADFNFVGGRVDVLVQDPTQITPVEAFEKVFAFDIANYANRKGFVGAGNLFCSRAIFDRVGPFANGVSEDVDWCHRATALRLMLGYSARAVVGHPARRSWIELKKKWSRIDSETFALKMRSGGGRLIWFLLGLALPISALIHTPKVLMSHRLSGSQQRLGALGVLYGIRLWRAWDYFRLLRRR